MKHAKMASLMLALMFLVAGYVLAEGGAGMTKPQTTCPVMGGKVNKEIYTDHEGKRVYFCCKACIGEFRKNPEKYVRAFEDEGVVLENAPGMAPDKKPNTGNNKGNTRPGSCNGCDGCS
jgi:YHS domain-containing protein